MHGVGESLPGLSDFIGFRLAEVDDLENIIYFRFVNDEGRKLEIGVESEWRICDLSGAIVASGHPRPEPHAPALPLPSTVVKAETDPPKAIVLTLSTGHTLRIIDDSDAYESFSLPHADVYI